MSSMYLQMCYKYLLLNTYCTLTSRFNIWQATLCVSEYGNVLNKPDNPASTDVHRCNCAFSLYWNYPKISQHSLFQFRYSFRETKPFRSYASKDLQSDSSSIQQLTNKRTILLLHSYITLKH